MKVALFLILGLSANHASATISADDYRFECFFKAQVDDSTWETRGPAQVTEESQAVRIEFSGTGLDFVQTTDTDGEYQVESRCTGYVVVTNDKPIKIRDLSFQENDVRIGTNDGKVELYSKGVVTNSKNETDEFDKNWTIKLSALKAYNAEKDDAKKAKLDPFAPKGESKTLCAKQLTLRFDDLRALAQRKQNQNKETAIELRHLLVTFDPC